MSTPQMDTAIAGLRLLLASIEDRDGEAEALVRQLRQQVKRALGYAVHGAGSLEGALSILGEIQERLDQAERRRGHLAAIRALAEQELEALDLTARIERSKRRLAELKAGEPPGPRGDAERQEVHELERFIEQASLRAGEAITGRSADRES